METPLWDGFTIYSGGALGTDSVAELAARELGMNLEIKIPPDHARARTVTPLTLHDLDEANRYVERAAKMLRRPFFFSHQQLQEQTPQEKFSHRAGSEGRVCF